MVVIFVLVTLIVLLAVGCLIVWLFLCLDFLVGCFCCFLSDDRFVVMSVILVFDCACCVVFVVGPSIKCVYFAMSFCFRCFY